MVELEASERELLVIGSDLMARLLASDDWLPTVFAQANPEHGQQLQLYSDQLERFTVVSTVLAGGQALPVYQDPVWEIMGVLRGAMTRQRFGVEGGPPQAKAEARRLEPRAVDTFSPKSGAAVRLANALGDSVSISIHVYGGEIGKLPRRVVGADGTIQEVASGYANPESAPPYDIYSIQTEIKD
jgi:predicted metal-dependent enzyme (double-stranded beta helix superfamily)